MMRPALLLGKRLGHITAVTVPHAWISLSAGCSVFLDAVRGPCANQYRTVPYPAPVPYRTAPWFLPGVPYLYPYLSHVPYPRRSFTYLRRFGSCGAVDAWHLRVSVRPVRNGARGKAPCRT